MERIPKHGMPIRSSSSIKKEDVLPYRLCLAGGWMDQPFINTYEPGSLVTIQIEPRDDFINRAGLATSTRKTWKNYYHFNPKINNKLN